MSTERTPTRDQRADGTEEAAEERVDRPDLAGPRGNQDVDPEDVARGEEKIARISGN
jgi:hypothetical protein